MCLYPPELASAQLRPADCKLDNACSNTASEDIGTVLHESGCVFCNISAGPRVQFWRYYSVLGMRPQHSWVCWGKITLLPVLYDNVRGEGMCVPMAVCPCCQICRLCIHMPLDKSRGIGGVFLFSLFLLLAGLAGCTTIRNRRPEASALATRCLRL